MAPQVRYARTSDGANIAYSTLGSGLPLVHMSIGVSHVQLEWQIPEMRRWYERLARSTTLVRFDFRGTGLSDRDGEDISLDTRVRDMEGVVDHLALSRFALFGQIHSGPIAVRYTAEHPERVSHLILFNTYARGADYSAVPLVEGTRRLLGGDWELWTETMAHATVGSDEGEPARRFAALVRESVAPEVAATAVSLTNTWDVTPLLAGITAPTLVLRGHQSPVPTPLASRLAAGIPNARFAVLEGSHGVPYLGDWEATAAEIEAFLHEGERGPSPAILPSGTAVILFLDIADSTALTERMGDAAFRAAARTLDERLRAAIGEAGGTPVDGKVLGDGVMAVFASAREAIDAALRCRALSAESELPLHLGIHAGDVIREGNNVYGGAVNIASRICALSEPGEVLVSATVRDLARTSAGVTFEDRGEQEMKGVGESVRVYAVRGKDA